MRRAWSCCAEIYNVAKAKLDEIAQARGFEGRLMAFSDPGMAPGDCRIEWADGGIARDHTATLATIDDVVARYVATRGNRFSDRIMRNENDK